MGIIHPLTFALVDLFDDIAITVTGSRRFKVEVTGLEAFQLNGEDTLTKVPDSGVNGHMYRYPCI